MAVWSRLDGESDDYADDVVETGSHHIGGVQKRKAALKRAVSASAATKVAVFLVQVSAVASEVALCGQSSRGRQSGWPLTMVSIQMQVVPIVFACYATLIGCALVIGGTGGCIDGTDGGYVPFGMTCPLYTFLSIAHVIAGFRLWTAAV